VAADPSAPMTLFLLDLCHAGAANRYWQPPKAGAAERAWVIAASREDQPAYGARLTRAATHVINAITSGKDDLASAVRTVSFDVLFERIRKQDRKLALAEAGYQQDPICTPVMGAQLELPLCLNPNYRAARLTSSRVRAWTAAARSAKTVTSVTTNRCIGVITVCLTAARSVSVMGTSARFGAAPTLIRRAGSTKIRRRRLANPNSGRSAVNTPARRAHAACRPAQRFEAPTGTETPNIYYE
jgi:hypothetical protein